MRNRLIYPLMLSCRVAPATAQVSIGIGLPNVSIGINLQTCPQLVTVPGYPVHYAPQLLSNCFFHDGLYWNQRRYTGHRYPRVEQQEELQARNYGYRPQDALLREHDDARRAQSAQTPQKGRDNGQRAPEARHQETGPQGKDAPLQSQRGQEPGQGEHGGKGDDHGPGRNRTAPA
jgi:hypothetical protein